VRSATIRIVKRLIPVRLYPKCESFALHNTTLAQSQDRFDDQVDALFPGRIKCADPRGTPRNLLGVSVFLFECQNFVRQGDSPCQWGGRAKILAASLTGIDGDGVRVGARVPARRRPVSMLEAILSLHRRHRQDDAQTEKAETRTSAATHLADECPVQQG
jgi:hypothetical protein